MLYFQLPCGQVNHWIPAVASFNSLPWSGPGNTGCAHINAMDAFERFRVNTILFLTLCILAHFLGYNEPVFEYISEGYP